MKKIILILLIFCEYSCNAQVYEKIEGVWLPEKYVSAIMNKDTSNIDNHSFPVEGFEINRERITDFINLTGNETDISENIIILKAYKSEYRTMLTESIFEDGKEKFKLLYFSSCLNMKYISRESVNQFTESTLFLSKKGDKLLLEIVGNDYKEEIYFICGITDYRFVDIESAVKYLQVNILK